MEDQDETPSHPSTFHTLSGEEYEQILSSLNNLTTASEKEESDSELEEDESDSENAWSVEERDKVESKRKLERLKSRYPYGLIPAKDLAPKTGAGYRLGCFLGADFREDESYASAAVGNTISDSNPCSVRLLKEIEPGFKVLDIGCSYGIQIFPLLHKGAHAVANDSDAYSLTNFADCLKPEDHKKVHISYGKFPEETSFPPNHFDAVTMYYVIHYMKPKEIKASFKKFHEILKPNGKVYIMTLSPFSRTFGWYTNRALLNQKKGHEWPGEIADWAQVWTEVTGQPKENLPETGLPNYMHPQFQETLMREAFNSGFMIEALGYCGISQEENRELAELKKKNLPTGCLGRSAAYLIAQKK
ncbi:MAG: hypothetical protein BGO67_12910 [Alphaproteobacteria bacterium 41-28]|nr:MAG: hypothetical protein BGO67_12910 [Alphaproteobacteria bacterium 41-28]